MENDKSVYDALKLKNWLRSVNEKEGRVERVLKYLFLKMDAVQQK